MRIPTALFLLAMLAASPAVAQAADDPQPSGGFRVFKEAGTGHVIALTRAAAQALAGRTGSEMSPDRVSTEAREFVAQHAGELGLSAAPEDLVALPAELDELGLGHQRFLIHHGGLPVFGGEVYVHLDRDGVYYATTKPMGEPPASLLPAVSARAAREAAVAWASRQLPPRVNAGVDVDQATLVILPMRVAEQRGSTESRLAWQVRVATDEYGTLDEQCFVDAGSGELLFHYSNNAQLTRQVYDCNTFPSTCGMDVWRAEYQYWFGRSEPYPVRGPHPIPGIFYGSRDVDLSYDYFWQPHSYYLTKFNRNGGNGEGGIGTGVYEVPVWASRALTHLDLMWGSCPAYAVLGTSKGQLQFCVGSVEAMDIFAHEYAHSIPLFTFRDQDGHPIGPVYSGEAGALNEAHSDLVADAVELQFSGHHNWMFGLSFLSDGTEFLSNLGIIRNMADPGSLTETAIDLPYPDRYNSPNVYCGEYDGGGLHHNSTIPSHSMYLAAEGGDFNGCTIAPIGEDAVERIWYRGWTTYFTRTVTFNEAYSALQQACADLYPDSVCAEFKKALQAVELDQPGYCSGLPGQLPLCNPAAGVPDETPLSPQLGRAMPNPASGNVRIAYRLPAETRVTLVIHDAAGRQVRQLVDGVMPAGDQTATWDLRNQSGQRVLSGIYFYRLTVAGRTFPGKIIAIR